MWFGDSYDIVKRFFTEALTSLNYKVYVDPMLTESWGSKQDEINYYKLLNAFPISHLDSECISKALLIDPDTGVKDGNSKHHVSFQQISEMLGLFDILISFDQSFSRGVDHQNQIQNKLAELEKFGCHGMFYDSHARFLFASKNVVLLNELESRLIENGLPNRRLIRKA